MLSRAPAPDADADKKKEEEEKTMEMRRAIANRLKAEVLGKWHRHGKINTNTCP